MGPITNDTTKHEEAKNPAGLTQQQADDAKSAETAKAHQATVDADAATQKGAQTAAVEGAKTAAAAPAGKTLVSGKHGSVFAHVKLDGKAKTLTMPVTGKALHLLAGEIDGHPITLKSGGTVIPNTDEPVDAKFLEFTTR